mmetsp:Transcript_13554/g.44263  ORF Transcript_13554/g.44263 Transcript_13554/m.44263 type:complete len:202 (+) Transcript_13554:289-894(+)
MGYPQRAARGGLSSLAQRRLRLHPGRLRSAGGGHNGPPRVGGHTQAKRRRGRDGHHGHPARAPDALHCRRLRQRVDRHYGHGHHLLSLGPGAAGRRRVAGRGPVRLVVHLHGGGVGRIRLRAQHDRAARDRPRPRRLVLPPPLARLHPLVPHWDRRGYFRPGPLPGRLAALPEPRAAGADGGLLRAAAVAADRAHGPPAPA